MGPPGLGNSQSRSQWGLKPVRSKRPTAGIEKSLGYLTIRELNQLVI
jgi:hypothetical protein